MSYNIKDYSYYSLKSENSYRDIVEIQFIPKSIIKELVVEKIHNKGDIVKKKLFGFTIFSRECLENEYRLSFSKHHYEGTQEEIFDKISGKFNTNQIFWLNDKIYHKAEMRYRHDGCLTQYRNFLTDEECEREVKKLKEKCEEVGNYLI